MKGEKKGVTTRQCRYKYDQTKRNSDDRVFSSQGSIRGLRKTISVGLLMRGTQVVLESP